MRLELVKIIDGKCWSRKVQYFRVILNHINSSYGNQETKSFSFLSLPNKSKWFSQAPTTHFTNFCCSPSAELSVSPILCTPQLFLLWTSQRDYKVGEQSSPLTWPTARDPREANSSIPRLSGHQLDQVCKAIGYLARCISQGAWWTLKQLAPLAPGLEIWLSISQAFQMARATCFLHSWPAWLPDSLDYWHPKKVEIEVFPEAAKF